MTDFAHLNEAARKLLRLSDRERMEFPVSDLWIDHSQASQTLDTLEFVMACPRRERMMNLLLSGPEGNGKTTLVRRFQQRHPVFDLEEGGIAVPVLVVSGPPIPKEALLHDAILSALCTALPNRSAEDKRYHVIQRLRRHMVRMLVIDDVEGLLVGKSRAHRLNLELLKYLSQAVPVTVVAVGTPAVLPVMQRNFEVASRFLTAQLPRWTLGPDGFALLEQFERSLPLKQPSHLTELPLAARILDQSNGTIGGIANLLRQATIRAIAEGSEKITVAALETCAARRLS